MASLKQLGDSIVPVAISFPSQDEPSSRIFTMFQFGTIQNLLTQKFNSGIIPISDTNFPIMLFAQFHSMMGYFFWDDASREGVREKIAARSGIVFRLFSDDLRG